MNGCAAFHRMPTASHSGCGWVCSLGHLCVLSYASVLAQIAILDIVFSLDSVTTALGMVLELSIMVAAPEKSA